MDKDPSHSTIAELTSLLTQANATRTNACGT
jgi:hypothetical protein